VTRNDGSGPNPTYSYHGFIPDLVLSLSKRLHFNYELYNVSVDYGHVKNNSTKEWTGLIGEVMRRDVRITLIFPLTIFSAYKFVNTSGGSRPGPGGPAPSCCAAPPPVFLGTNYDALSAVLMDCNICVASV